MAQLLVFPARFVSAPTLGGGAALPQVRSASSEWAVLQRKLRVGGRHFCFFTDGRKQDQARKALESALGGKKTEFDEWNKEIEKRNSSSAGGGGGASGRGGWFGGGGWFGWSKDENFWNEAKQAGITVGAILSLYLLLTKGGVMFAVVSNSLLFVLRGVRTRAELVLSFFSGKVFNASSSPPSAAAPSSFRATTQSSAKERVVSKWATD